MALRAGSVTAAAVRGIVLDVRADIVTERAADGAGVDAASIHAELVDVAVFPASSAVLAVVHDRDAHIVTAQLVVGAALPLGAFRRRAAARDEEKEAQHSEEDPAEPGGGRKGSLETEGSSEGGFHPSNRSKEPERGPLLRSDAIHNHWLSRYHRAVCASPSSSCHSGS